MKKSCIVLCSSGIDSVSCLYWAKKNYEHVLALFIDYGQKNRSEEGAFFRIVKQAQIEWWILKFDLCQIGGSALTDNIDVPKDRYLEEIEKETPITFIPGRNLLFIGLAGALAYTRKISDVIIAVNTIDASSYPDTTPLFINHMQTVLDDNLSDGTLERQINIVTPVIRMRKSEIIKFGLEWGADFSYSISCYESEIPCGIPKNSRALSLKEIQERLGGCDSCQLRAKGFQDAELIDPLLKRLRSEGRI